MSDLSEQLNREVRLTIGALCVDKMELQIALAQARAELEKLNHECRRSNDQRAPNP